MELLQYEFMQRALVGGTIIGLLCPLVGTFVVLRGYALIGDGLGHVAFAGVGMGLLLGVYPVAAAGILAVVAALALERMRGAAGTHRDIGLALVFYAGIALAVVTASLARSFDARLLGFLFGSILTITPLDLAVIGLLAAAVAGTLWALWRALFAVALDEEAARVAGLPVGRLNDLIVVLVAVTVVIGMRVAGVLLVAALMVVPVAAALQLARSFRGCVIGSAVAGVAAVWLGIAVSFYFDLAPGATIVLAAIALFGLAGLLARGRALAAGRRLRP